MPTGTHGRTPLVAGNWKMHKTVDEATALAREVAALAAETGGGVEVLVAPPATALAAVAAVVRERGSAEGEGDGDGEGGGGGRGGGRLLVGAQNGHWAEQGAFTGEIGMRLLSELVTHVIVGHSERRALFGERDDDVNRKVHAAFAAGLTPIACVGETADERDVGSTDDVVGGQVDAATDGLAPAEAARLVIAYEPVWAIGTGRACDAAEAARVCRLIRDRLAERFGAEAGGTARVLYGGSVTAENAAHYFAAPDVDGALVGGASLRAETFSPIVHAAAAG